MQVFGRLSQEQIVFGLAVLLCIVFAVALPGFLTANNILNLVRSVSILGILGVAMGLVVIGRGIDLSLVALMAISVAWTLHLIGSGMPLPQALAIGLAFSLFIGAVNGMARRLCRDPGDLRDAGHGHAGLRLRPLLPVRSRRRLHARRGAAACCGSARARCSAFRCRSSSSPPSASAAISSCATPSRAAICARSATICSPRASPASRRGRSSSCNTCCRR